MDTAPAAASRTPPGVGAAVDLHLHTCASDGRWTPETLVGRVAALGIGVMAVTDHDTLDAVAPAAALAAARGIALVPGVEVTTCWGGRQWDLLVYGADPVRGALHDLVARQRRALVERAREAIDRLRAGDYAVPSLDAAIDGRPPLPIYVSDALVRDGLAPTIPAANRFVTEQLGVPFAIDAPLAEAVAAAHAAGGVAILAHPGRDEGAGILAPEQLGRLLAHAPLDGLEVYYPTHSAAQVAEYGALAERHGLVRSCGSDSHGPGFPHDPIPYPAAPVAPLLERLGRPPVRSVRRSPRDPLATGASPGNLGATRPSSRRRR